MGDDVDDRDVKVVCINTEVIAGGSVVGKPTPPRVQALVGVTEVVVAVGLPQHPITHELSSDELAELIAAATRAWKKCIQA